MHTYVSETVIHICIVPSHSWQSCVIEQHDAKSSVAEDMPLSISTNICFCESYMQHKPTDHTDPTVQGQLKLDFNSSSQLSSKPCSLTLLNPALNPNLIPLTYHLNSSSHSHSSLIPWWVDWQPSLIHHLEVKVST